MLLHAFSIKFIKNEKKINYKAELDEEFRKN